MSSADPSHNAPSASRTPGTDAPGSRAAWATSVVAEVRRLDPSHAAALFQVYVRRRSREDAAVALGVTVEQFGATLAAAMSALGRRLAAA